MDPVCDHLGPVELRWVNWEGETRAMMMVFSFCRCGHATYYVHGCEKVCRVAGGHGFLRYCSGLLLESRCVVVLRKCSCRIA